jgi:anti-anti-sigma regulatory factor
VQRAVTAAPPGEVHSLVVDMEAVTDVDVTGAEAFTALKQWLVEHDIALSFSRVRSEARERLVTFGLLEGETVYPTNRAAIEALVPPVGWREKLRERLFPHTARPEQPRRADADREQSGPPTEPIHITRSSN